jgi:hypothetical protein
MRAQETPVVGDKANLRMARGSLWSRYLLIALVAATLGGLIGFGVARGTEARQWPDLAFTTEKWKAPCAGRAIRFLERHRPATSPY